MQTCGTNYHQLVCLCLSVFSGVRLLQHIHAARQSCGADQQKVSWSWRTLYYICTELAMRPKICTKMEQ